MSTDTGHPDTTLGFMVPRRNARGQVVRLTGTLDAILSAHDYPEPLVRLLGEALAVTALVGATLRQDDGQVTLQAQARGGIVDLMVCDWRAGELRGYLSFDGQAIVQDGMTLPELFGDGHLAITLDQSVSGERYQGVVALEGDTLCHALEGYFASSEQLPTFLRVALARDANGWVAGGLLIQHLARAEIGGERLDAGEQHPDWEHVRALAETVAATELTDTALAPEALLWRLFHEEAEVRVTPGPALAKGCRCSEDHIREVLSRFPEAERAEMRGDDGLIAVDCKFCSRVFGIAA